MINLGAYYHGPDGQDLEFNEYVMPYGKVCCFFFPHSMLTLDIDGTLYH